jgi:DNA polymerase I-like protein with 3'-5' exonuclease and polymerase domains
MSIKVLIYSEQPLNRDAYEIVEQVLQDYPPNTFVFTDVTAIANGAINNAGTGQNMIILGSCPFKFTKAIRTYSVAQLCTKANAASVLKAALNQLYLPQKTRPASAFVNSSINRFDFDKPIAVDIETAGDLATETPEQVKILSIAFYQDGNWDIWDMRGVPYFADWRKDILRKIQYPIWHNGKFDTRVIEAQTGVRMPNYFDTMLAHHVLNMAAGLHALKPLCKMYLGAPEWEADLSKYLKNKAHYENVPADILNEYNLWDVYWTYELWQYLEPLILADEEASKAFMLEMAASEFLLDVEQFGFAIDVPYAQQLAKQMELEAIQLHTELSFLTRTVQLKNPKAGFNPSSWQQVQTVLSTFMGGVYAASTDEKSLLNVKKAWHHNQLIVDFIDKLLEYRKTVKALNTYVKGALSAEVNGRVHTTFKIHGTSTGRLSSAQPNIQNIPRDKKFRSIYVG